MSNKNMSLRCARRIITLNTGSAKYLFFWKMLKKILLNIFLNFFFYLKVQSFRLIMENNFIQMAASAGHGVDYTIGPIFKHIIDCVRQLSLPCQHKTYL